MSYYAPCALRTHRRTWGLSQQELAEILDFESPAQVSRIEHGKRVPRIEIALACSTLFGVSLDELFPQLAAEIEQWAGDCLTGIGGELTEVEIAARDAVVDLNSEDDR